MNSKKIQGKTNDLLAEWKNKYIAKENERICQHRNYEEIKHENNIEIKELKEQNAELIQLISNKSKKNDKRYLKYVLNSKNMENVDENNLLDKIDLNKANSLISESFYHELNKLNMAFYKRREIEKNLDYLDYLKKRLIKEIKYVKDDKRADSVEMQIRDNQNYYEKIKIKYETSCYTNRILSKILREFNDYNKEVSREIDSIKVEFSSKIQKINDLKVELKENIKTRNQIKFKVEKLEKELVERKQKRQEYVTIMQQELEDAKIIRIDQSKIRLDRQDKGLRNGQSFLIKAVEDENLRKEELRFKYMDHFYDNHLKLQILATSLVHDESGRNKIECLNEKINLFVGLINILFAQKCSLENELDLIKSEYFEYFCLHHNLDEHGTEMIKAFDTENSTLNELVNNISYKNDKKNHDLCKIAISIAGLCAKVMNFRILNEETFKKLPFKNELQVKQLTGKLNIESINTEEKKNKNPARSIRTA